MNCTITITASNYKFSWIRLKLKENTTDLLKLTTS